MIESPEEGNHSCKSCRYWGNEQCRYYPPKLIVGARYGNDLDYHTQYEYDTACPRVNENDWCGKWYWNRTKGE